MLIRPSQLNTAQIKNRSDRKGGWLQMWGFTSMLITKCILNMRPMMRAAAKVFIYMKRLSTYIIRIITNERILKKKLHLMTDHTISPNLKSLFHHPPIRWDFIFSLETGDRWDLETRSISLQFSYYEPICFEKWGMKTVEPPVPVSHEWTGKQLQFFSNPLELLDRGDTHFKWKVVNTTRTGPHHCCCFFILITGYVRAVIWAQSNWRATRNSLGLSFPLWKKKTASCGPWEINVTPEWKQPAYAEHSK